MPKSQRCEREGGEIVCLTGADAAAAMPEVTSVEARSWKQQRGRLDFQDAVPAARLRLAFETLPDRMELWLARVKGETVAYQVAFRMPERIGLYACAYDHDYRRYSPGILVMFNAVRRAWQAGAREYDFMRGVTTYKVERSSGVRPLQTLVLHPTTPAGWFAFAVLVAPRWYLREIPVLRWIVRGLRDLRARLAASPKRAREHTQPAS